MNRHLIRLVSCLLASAIVGANPEWPVVFAGAGRPETVLPSTPGLFAWEAVVEPLDGGFVGNQPAVRMRKAANLSRLGAFLGIAALFVSPAAIAQQTKAPSHPPVVRLPVPQAGIVERQNRRLTDAQWKDAWHLADDSTDPRTLNNQLRVVTNNSTKVGEKFYAHRAAWESLLAIRTDDGKSSTNRSDSLHAAGVGTSRSTIGQVLSYPGISATQPKRRVETADFEPVDKNHPGFLHWRTLVQYAGRVLRVALDGVQIYSKNQVEMSYLQEHAADFKVRQAYAELEEAVHEEHAAAVQAWLDYATQVQKPAELREAAWMETRALDRERAAAPREGRGPAEYFRLQAASQRAVEAYHASHNDREPLRVHWLETVGHAENDLSRAVSTPLHLTGSPGWPMNRDLFSLAEAVGPLLAKEQVDENVFVPESLPLPPAGEWNATPPALPDGSYAPDSFLKISDAPREGGNINETAVSELESLFSAAPVDVPLGTSPRQRLLELQKENIETVQQEMLDLQKQPTWNVGAHVDLGTQPFIAALLNWDYRRPGRSRILSLGELKTELQLRAQEIDQEVIGDRKRLRGLWLGARTRRQTALAMLVDARNQIIIAHAQRQAALLALQGNGVYLSADAITPALQIERLKKEYARHMTEAWAAWQVMRLYSAEGQKRVVAETQSHYLQVMKKIDPENEVAPEQLNPQKAVKGLRIIIPALLMAMIHLGTATVSSAHTFVLQTAGAAAQAAGQLVTGGMAHQVAMDAVVGTYTGGPENSLSGMAVNILRALHPDHPGRFSSKEIAEVVNRIMQGNGIADPLKMRPETLHLGSFDPAVAERLQTHQGSVIGHHAASVAQPGIVHAAVPQVAAQTPMAPPAAGHPGDWSSWLHSAITWISTPEHLLWIAAGLLTAYIVFRILRSPGRRSANGKAYPPFSPERSIPRSGTLPFYVRRLWVPLAIGLVGVLRLGAVTIPKMVASKELQASALALLHSPWLPVTVIILSIAFSARLRYRLGRHRIVMLLLTPILLACVWFGSFRTRAVKPVFEMLTQHIQHRAEVLSQSDSLATNYGVSVQPARLPVVWTVPQGAAGVVTAVDMSRQTLSPNDLVIALEAMDEDLLNRMNAANEQWQRLYGKPLIDPVLIATAARKHDHDAFVRIAPHPETSVDHLIIEWMDQIDTLMFEQDRARALAEQNRLATGHGALSFDAEAQLMRMRALGLKISAKLLERSLYNVPATRSVRILPGAGRLAKGSEIGAGATVTLCTQELADETLLQLKLPPAEAAALWNQLQNNPEGTLLRMAVDGEILSIPLSQIDQFVGEDDPSFGREARDESFFGPQYTNPSAGASPTIPVSLIIRQNPAKPTLDTSKRYQFVGLFDGDRRLIEPTNNVTLGMLAIGYETSAQPPHRSLRGPLEEERRATLTLVADYETLAEDVERFQKLQFPEGTVAPRLLIDYRQELRRLTSKVGELDQQIANINRSGIEIQSGIVQPRDPVRYSHYPMERRFPLSSEEDGLANLGGSVRASVIFDAPSEEIGTNGSVRIHLPGAKESLLFAIVQSKSLDRTNTLTRYVAERTMPASEAAKLFPHTLPLTKPVLAEIQFNGTTPNAAPPPRGGPSQLKGHELITALAWTLGAAALSLSFALPSNNLFSWVLGYGAAVAVHELLGHGIPAYFGIVRRGGHARLRLSHGNLEWQERDGNRWVPILNPRIQRSGPLASRLAMILASAMLLLVLFPGIHLLSPFFLGSVLISSAVFRNADQSAGETPALSAALHAGVEPIRPINEEPLIVRNGSNGVPDYLDENQLILFAESLKGKALEYERYWVKGNPTTYLTFWQIFWDVYIRHKDKVALKERKVFLQRFERENLTNRRASVLDQHYQLNKKEIAAGSKTRTMLWVLVIFVVGVASLVFFASPDTVRSVILMLKANPIVLFATSNPLLGFMGLLFAIFVGGWVFGSASEFWGKLIATTPWNLKFLKLKTIDALFAPEKRFQEDTGKDAMAELTKIYGTEILHPQDDEYKEFMMDFDRFARQIADRAYVRLRSNSFDAPSQQALAFANAFRIQVRTSRTNHAPIYPKHPVELADPDTLLLRLRERLGIRLEEPPPEVYYLLECARVEEAVSLARQYPVHTLMALLRSGNAELIADVRHMDHRGLIQQILKELKERTDTLDPDVSDDVRAQERLGEFFDLLHYVFEGLRGSSNAIDARYQRRRLLAYLDRAVTPVERPTWNSFVANLDTLMNETGKTTDQITSDQNIIRGIVYVLTERRLKESETESRELLGDLRRESPHPPEITLEDGYLRNAEGTPSTNVLQLNMAYQKYFDLLREFSARFPKIHILGNADLYITCENTVNFRQTLRETELFLHLTGGRVYLVNVARTHPRFAKLLNANIPLRLPWSLAHRVRIRSLENLLLQRRLLIDRKAIILSSATPLEWRAIAPSAGIRVHETTPLAKMALISGLLNTLHHDELHALFASRRQKLDQQYQDLHDQSVELEAELARGWQDLKNEGVRISEPRSIRRSLWGSAGIIGEKMRLHLCGSALSRLQHREDDLAKQRIAIRHEARELIRLERELEGVPYFLRSIGMDLRQFRDGEPMPKDPPPVVSTDPMDGRYRLDMPFYLMPADPPVRIRWFRTGAGAA